MTKKKATSAEGGLSASQQDAIRLLVSGCTAKYTALVLKLNYADIRRWMSKDIRFQSELAAQVEKLRAQASDFTESPQDKKRKGEKSRGEILRATKRL